MLAENPIRTAYQMHHPELQSSSQQNVKTMGLMSKREDNGTYVMRTLGY